jgi:hypothetical protein
MVARARMPEARRVAMELSMMVWRGFVVRKVVVLVAIVSLSRWQ